MTKQLIAAVVLAGTFGAGLSLGPVVERMTTVKAQTPGTQMTQTFPNRRYNQGVDTFGPVQIPVGATSLIVRATRDAWPDTGDVVLQVVPRLSLDGGNTWIDWGGFGAMGGDLIKRDGSIAAESSLGSQLPDPQNPLRQLRGVITVNRALNTAVTVQIQ